MVKHIVMWRFPNEEISREAKRQLESLVGKVSQIVDLEAGINFNSGAAAYDLVLYCTFRSSTDLDAYQVHEEHNKVALYIKQHATDRVVVDYEV